MRPKNNIRYLLINPPLTDPTTPYHSISYLVGSTSCAGYNNFICLDSNIECLCHIIEREESVKSLIDYCIDVRTNLEKKSRLTRGEQLLYRYALKAVGLKPDSGKLAIEIMRNPQLFYNYDKYRQAILIIKRLMDVLSVKGFPGQFNDSGFGLDLSIANFSSVTDLTNSYIINKIANPFRSYFEGPFSKILAGGWHLIGISVNYISQLPFALYMFKLIRSTLPDCIICAGGTEITDDVKYMRDKHLLWNLFSDCDAIVIGEGESALTAILDSVCNDEAIPKDYPGVLVKGDPIVLDDFRLSIHMNYENLSTLPSPRYDIWNWNQYWSPEPIILYSPTRGCYWNKCTFCDYGLNTSSPTSPSRQRPIQILINEMKNILRIGRIVYLAVDAISPAYLRRFSELIIENNFEIHWSAELRLEKLFRTELAHKLRKAGCVCISFGYESGTQRILDLIDKGVKIDEVSEVLKELANMNIGVQMMGFIGFPTETIGEAIDTYRFLQQNLDNWAIAGIGNFVLTSGSIVARNYNKFNIDKVCEYEREDINRDLYYVQNGKQRLPGDLRSTEIRRASKSIIRVMSDRPFIGGIDSSHTMLYFTKYGKKLLPNCPSETFLCTKESDTKGIIEAVVTYKVNFENMDKFVDKLDRERYYSHRRIRGGVSFEDIDNWLKQYPTNIDRDIRNDDAREQILEIYRSGDYVVLAKDDIIKPSGTPAYTNIKEMLLQRKGYL